MEFLNALPILPLTILVLFVVVGLVAFYFLYILPKRKQLQTNLPPSIPNIPPPPSTLNTTPISTVVNPQTAASMPNSPIATASQPAPIANLAGTPPPNATLLNKSPEPISTPFYKNSLFLIIIFVFLLIAIPTVIYFGVKRQQSLSGRAVNNCADCKTIDNYEECYSNAGSGCNWRINDPGNITNGSCYCTRSDTQPTATPVPGGEDQKCCSGSPECGNDGQCVDRAGSCKDKGQGVCITKPYTNQGCCKGPEDCAPWEVCSGGNSACPDTGDKSCKSKAGCKYNTDCLSGKCQLGGDGVGTCVGEGTLECHADSGGVSVVNKTGQDLKCSGSYSTCQERRSTKAECPASGGCQGQSHPISEFPLAKDGSKNFGSIQPVCDLWQTDIQINCGGLSCSNSDHGCEWDDTKCGGATPTPTPTGTVGGVCSYIKAYNAEGTVITDFSTIRAGQVIRFAVKPSSAEFTRGRFQVNSGVWQPNDDGTSQKNTAGEFYMDYTVPIDTTSFTIKAMAKHPVLGWK